MDDGYYSRACGALTFSDGHITYEKIRDKLGLVGVERLNSIFEACAQNQTEAVINLLDEFLQGGISIEQLISNCADYLRSLLLIKSGVKKESLLGNSPERYSSLVLGAWNNIQVERALSISVVSAGSVSTFPTWKLKKPSMLLRHFCRGLR